MHHLCKLYHVSLYHLFPHLISTGSRTGKVCWALHFAVVAIAIIIGEVPYSALSVPATITLGGAVIDAGNNDHLPNIIRANYPTCSRGFVNHHPTKRFFGMFRAWTCTPIVLNSSCFTLRRPITTVLMYAIITPAPLCD
ncbi:hypothetical protein L1987_32638 [Smallanthus sonchifolius]|uniref:Uncharacterized protein n=1 Tax=Smallanthus sonchifolius TaxID=185202 RepID=A0ACB9HRD5_9ASTR|nr:hypothetical protein L1987_32638 [Smallanthus sonchifolius]